MDRQAAETSVKVIAILTAVEGAFVLLMALPMAVGAGFMGFFGFGRFGFVESAFIGALMVVMGLFLAALAVVFLLVAKGLWDRRDWARVAGIVIGAVSLFAFPVGTLIGGFTIYVLAFEKEAIALFGPPRAAS